VTTPQGVEFEVEERRVRDKDIEAGGSVDFEIAGVDLAYGERIVSKGSQRFDDTEILPSWLNNLKRIFV
jgi:hypothetical protein